MPATMTYTALADLLRATAPSCGDVRVVAVDGRGGAGKTTFARRLGQALGARVVHSDDFPVPWEEGPGHWFSHLADQVFAPLARGEAARFRRYDWQGGGYAEWIDVPVAPVLIVEGVSTARPACPAAYRIWIEAPRGRRLERALARDGARYAGQWATWTEREDAWFAANPSVPDLVVDGLSLDHDEEFRTR